MSAAIAEMSMPAWTRTEPRRSIYAESPLRKLDENYTQRNRDEGIHHLFGIMKFNFDKVKEFLLYYPKFNLSNVVKTHKKIWMIHHKSRRLK